MILLIDNYDSFTFNIYQQVAGLGFPVTVIRNDEVSADRVAAFRPSHVVISPGPGGPSESGISPAVIRAFYRTVPILGICLGHQCLGAVFGSRVVRLRKPWHGKVSNIRHSGRRLFRGVANPFAVARYHSLALDRVPRGFELAASTSDGTVMAIQHRERPVYGIQFHPESFLTPSGKKVMENFLR
ncbi:MAG: aminodeoxychorismate/anthranilate synthase component II [Patescibacteria group bacterium]